MTLASVSSISLVTCYTLASPRGKHPYLLWTALVGLIGGQGVEYWFNGWTRFTLKRQSKETGYVEVESSEINGEKVEAEFGEGGDAKWYGFGAIQFKSCSFLILANLRTEMSIC